MTHLSLCSGFDSPKIEAREMPLPVFETPEFKRWFAGSKVVDSNGIPLVVYHGSTHDVNQFQDGFHGATDPGFLGRGFYFSSNPATSAAYTLDKGRICLPGANLLPVYLQICNPYYATTRDKESGALKSFGGKSEFAQSRRLELESLGYDGVVLDYSKGGWANEIEYVAFNGTQIKSAIGNNGQFDPLDPRIDR